MIQTKDDIKYMKRVFELAKMGAGAVSPNPLVGAVIVKNGKIIGEGYHQKYGDPHAEVNAINQSVESPEGATLYCNLEPCCHQAKQTPPCVPEIINSGINKVVISNPDPNPKVNGKGLEQLRARGVQVLTGILENEGCELNRFFFKYISKNMPYITVKLAQTLDGYISRSKNMQEWISGQKAQQLVHQWRAQYDAVIVGANTLRVDNAYLTVRHSEGRDPVRIILSVSLDLDKSLKIFQHKSPQDTWVFTTVKADPVKLKGLTELGCRVIPLDSNGDNQVSLSHLLSYLAEQKITSILVEGGQKLASQFLFSDNFDELKIFIAPKIWGEGLSAFKKGPDGDFPQLDHVNSQKVGEDLLLTFHPQRG